MEIKVRYENQVTTIQVPEEDFTVMIEMDYQERCAAADDPASITRRTPQEILDTEINRPDYNNWHRHWRHTDGDAIPPRLDHKAGLLRFLLGEKRKLTILVPGDTVSGIEISDIHDGGMERETVRG